MIMLFLLRISPEEFLTENVMYGARVCPRPQTYRLVPVDDVAGQTEAV